MTEKPRPQADPEAAPDLETIPGPEVVHVDQHRVSCDGGGAMGHPVVWYSLQDGVAECGYCDRKFVYRPKA